mmetsp:Transcript_6343/g.26952  ORF Transcript_6343/g.26952 Transcript_6343/m.26952 type:complete len:203 (+) Transcript_6343:10-618(+)
MVIVYVLNARLALTSQRSVCGEDILHPRERLLELFVPDAVLGVLVRVRARGAHLVGARQHSSDGRARRLAVAQQRARHLLAVEPTRAPLHSARRGDPFRKQLSVADQGRVRGVRPETPQKQRRRKALGVPTAPRAYRGGVEAPVQPFLQSRARQKHLPCAFQQRGPRERGEVHGGFRHHRGLPQRQQARGRVLAHVARQVVE